MDKELRLGNLAPELRHDIHSFIKRIDKEMICLGQGTQIGKSSSRAIEAPRHDINTCVKRIDKEMIGFGQGTLVGKSSSIGFAYYFQGRSRKSICFAYAFKGLSSKTVCFT